ILYWGTTLLLCQEERHELTPCTSPTYARYDRCCRAGGLSQRQPLWGPARGVRPPLCGSALGRSLAPRGPSRGRGPLALGAVVVMQYIEGLTERQAAAAVRRCMAWQY